MHLQLFFVVIILSLQGSYGHGRLVDPPARGTMWRLGFSTPPNYNDHELFCGGFARQWMENKGRCGECGDPFDLPRPRPNESGGTFGTGIVSRAYRKGEEITITVHLTANHLGWFEFRLCENNIPKQFVKQNCLNKNVLELVDHPGTRYELKHPGHGLFRIRVKLPEDVICTNCVIQWHYTSGNNWGFCPGGVDKVGCGPQEVFRGCSDVAIFEESDDRYFKFENLTRVIDYSQTLKVNDKSGMYEIDSDGNSDSENDIDWKEKGSDQDKDNDKDKPKERDNSKDKDEDKQDDEGYSKGSTIKAYSSESDDEEDTRTFSNARTYANINRHEKSRYKDQEKKGYDRLFNDRETIDDNEREIKGGGDPSAFKEGNYVYSNTFRKSLSLEEQSKIRDYLQNLPSKELKSKELQHLINRPKSTASTFNGVDNPEFLLDLESLSPETNTITKLSEVLSLLLSLTASTSSASEANFLLDKLSQSLSRAVEHKQQLSVVGRAKSSSQRRTSSFYADRDSPEDTIDDEADLELYLPLISKRHKAASVLPRRSLALSSSSSSSSLTAANPVSSSLSSSRRNFARRYNTKERSRIPSREIRSRNKWRIKGEIDRSSEEQNESLSSSSIENFRTIQKKFTRSIARSKAKISLSKPSTRLPELDPILKFLRPNSSLGVTASSSPISSLEVGETQPLVYLLVRGEE